MSASSVGFPTSFDRFTAIYQWDFEFRTCKKTHLPIPVALFVKEQRTGVEYRPLQSRATAEDENGPVRYGAFYP